jgi:hypothetical protein
MQAYNYNPAAKLGLSLPMKKWKEQFNLLRKGAWPQNLPSWKKQDTSYEVNILSSPLLPVTSSFFGPNILLDIFLLKILSLCPSFRISDQVSYQHKAHRNLTNKEFAVIRTTTSMATCRDQGSQTVACNASIDDGRYV